MDNLRKNDFALFAGYDYYPEGGWNDFQGGYPTLQEAKEAALKISKKVDWYQIVDLLEMKVVEWG